MTPEEEAFLTDLTVTSLGAKVRKTTSSDDLQTTGSVAVGSVYEVISYSPADKKVTLTKISEEASVENIKSLPKELVEKHFELLPDDKQLEEA
jgi:hypothetical protein